MSDYSDYVVWECKIVMPKEDVVFPDEGRHHILLRKALLSAVKDAGVTVLTCFSGGGGSLTTTEKLIVDKGVQRLKKESSEPLDDYTRGYDAGYATAQARRDQDENERLQEQEDALLAAEKKANEKKAKPCSADVFWKSTDHECIKGTCDHISNVLCWGVLVAYIAELCSAGQELLDRDRAR